LNEVVKQYLRRSSQKVTSNLNTKKFKFNSTPKINL